MIGGRLSDALNKREPIAIDEVTWAPVDGVGAARPRARPEVGRSVRPRHRGPGRRRLAAGHDRATSAPPTGSTRCPTRSRSRCRPTGSSGPSTCTRARSRTACSSARPRCSSRSSTRSAYLGDQPIGGGPVAAILVNRQYLRGVEQVDVRTGERHQKLPGLVAGRHQLDGSVALTRASRARPRGQAAGGFLAPRREAERRPSRPATALGVPRTRSARASKSLGDLLAREHAR